MTVEDAFLFLRSDYGGSTYCLHSDGSGRCYSSRLRPLLGMRPNMPLGDTEQMAISCRGCAARVMPSTF